MKCEQKIWKKGIIHDFQNFWVTQVMRAWVWVKLGLTFGYGQEKFAVGQGMGKILYPMSDLAAGYKWAW